MSDSDAPYDFVEPDLPDQRLDEGGRLRRLFRHLIEMVR